MISKSSNLTSQEGNLISNSPNLTSKEGNLTSISLNLTSLEGATTSFSSKMMSKKGYLTFIAQYLISYWNCSKNWKIPIWRCLPAVTRRPPSFFCSPKKKEPGRRPSKKRAVGAMCHEKILSFHKIKNSILEIFLMSKA